MANSAADLQAMIDSLQDFCSKWRLLVNVHKTKCMGWNYSGQVPRFRYGDEPIEVVT